MTDDIVTRLRDETMYCSQTVCEACATTREAADEIERLREDRDRWRNTAQDLLKAVRGE